MVKTKVKSFCHALTILLTSFLITSCAGLPVGRRTFIVLGVGVVRIDKSNSATGISSHSVGLTAGCKYLTIGAQASYCASLPVDGDVAIIEQGSGANQHLIIKKENQ